MKILIYSTNFAPDLRGSASIPVRWLLGLPHVDMKCGWFVRRPITPCGGLHRITGAQPTGASNGRALISGVRRFWVPKSPTGLTRVLHLLSFAFTSFPLLLCKILHGCQGDIAFASLDAPVSIAVGASQTTGWRSDTLHQRFGTTGEEKSEGERQKMQYAVRPVGDFGTQSGARQISTPFHCSRL